MNLEEYLKRNFDIDGGLGISGGGGGGLSAAELDARLPFNVGGHTSAARVAVTRPADTLVYAAGDAWANSTSSPVVPSFTAARIPAGSGILTSLVLSLSANLTTKPAFTIMVFDTAYTPIADNAVIALSYTSASRLVAIFSVTPADWRITNPGAGANGNIVAHVAPISASAFKCNTGSQSLFVLIRLDNAYTPTSGETLTLTFSVQQD